MTQSQTLEGKCMNTETITVEVDRKVPVFKHKYTLHTLQTSIPTQVETCLPTNL